jgi:hypothetical protein
VLWKRNTDRRCDTATPNAGDCISNEVVQPGRNDQQNYIVFIEVSLRLESIHLSSQ